MRRYLAGALSGAAVALLAGQAGATVMTAALSGDFDDGAPHGYWGSTFSYDTSLGTIQTFSNYQVLSWNASSGKPSPILWGTATDFQAQYDSAPPYPAPVTVDLSTATGFSILMAPWAYMFSITGPGWSLNVGESAYGNPNRPIFPSAIPSFDSAFSSGFAGEYGELHFDNLHQGSPATTSMLITAPEPGTWSMMLLGFLGIGAAIRLRRAAPGFVGSVA